jgi:hypothetical protein
LPHASRTTTPRNAHRTLTASTSTTTVRHHFCRAPRRRTPQCAVHASRDHISCDPLRVRTRWNAQDAWLVIVALLAPTLDPRIARAFGDGNRRHNDVEKSVFAVARRRSVAASTQRGPGCRRAGFAATRNRARVGPQVRRC